MKEEPMNTKEEPMKEKHMKNTPGACYVNEWLTSAELLEEAPFLDTGWVAESIDDGKLVICPRCHFLNLPVRPYPLDTIPDWPDPLDACLICAYAYGADDLAYYFESKDLASAAGILATRRIERAKTLYDLWMGPSLAADTWAMAEMGKAAQRVKDPSRQDMS